MINPMRPVSYGAFMVNRISDEMLKDAPAFDEVLPSFLDFIGDACLVAHNIKFDLGFLSHELSRMRGGNISNTKTLDTLKMARGLLPGLPRYSLLSIAHSLDVGDRQEHRAMADVELTFKVFIKLLEAADRQDIFKIDSLINCYGHKKNMRLSGGVT
jgi:DNA polymerase-3 subunit alpha (Gram-positive type)